MPPKTAISSRETDLSKPSIAFFDNLIISINKGIITGKLSMAINVPLLFALEAMADIIVKTVEKLMAPIKTAKK